MGNSNEARKNENNSVRRINPGFFSIGFDVSFFSRPTVAGVSNRWHVLEKSGKPWKSLWFYLVVEIRRIFSLKTEYSVTRHTFLKSASAGSKAGKELDYQNISVENTAALLGSIKI